MKLFKKEAPLFVLFMLALALLKYGFVWLLRYLLIPASAVDIADISQQMPKGLYAFVALASMADVVSFLVMAAGVVYIVSQESRKKFLSALAKSGYIFVLFPLFVYFVCEPMSQKGVNFLMEISGIDNGYMFVILPYLLSISQAFVYVLVYSIVILPLISALKNNLHPHQALSDLILHKKLIVAKTLALFFALIASGVLVAGALAGLLYVLFNVQSGIMQSNIVVTSVTYIVLTFVCYFLPAKYFIAQLGKAEQK